MQRVFAFFETMLDAILPPRERSARTKKRTIEDIELRPTDHSLLGQKITTLMDYREATVQDLVQSLKYDKSVHAAHLAAEVLADFLREEIWAQKNFSPREIVIVPVPLHAPHPATNQTPAQRAPQQRRWRF